MEGQDAMDTGWGKGDFNSVKEKTIQLKYWAKETGISILGDAQNLTAQDPQAPCSC